jgi:hypothetical protein
MMIPISNIHVPQLCRAGTVQWFRQLIRDGRKLPTIHVRRRGDRYVVADGTNRLVAAIHEGLAEVDCEIV